MENKVFDGFFTEFFLETLENILEKNLCEKTIKYFIFHLDGK